jgi:hypothetical protein
MEGAINVVRAPGEPHWVDGNNGSEYLYGFAMGFSASPGVLSSREKTTRFVRRMCRKSGTAQPVHYYHLTDVEDVFCDCRYTLPGWRGEIASSLAMYKYLE